MKVSCKLTVMHLILTPASVFGSFLATVGAGGGKAGPEVAFGALETFPDDEVDEDSSSPALGLIKPLAKSVFNSFM